MPHRARFAAALIALASNGVLAAPPTVGGCQVFPANNYWNTPIDNLPVHPSSNAWVTTIGNTARLHADWGNNLADNYGIPFVTVPAGQPMVPICPDLDHPECLYSDESDPGPYPIPPEAPIEGGAASDGDRHVLVIDTSTCILYELYRAFPLGGPTNAWNAASYAKFNLNVNGPLRPAGWTSADAAGLPIFPGLLRWEEITAPGEIEHAVRFTAVNIWGRENGQAKYLWPARHWSGNSTTFTRPPMGARFRLKANFDITPYGPVTQKILRAFKKYGLVLADAGSNWFFQGVSDANWPDYVFSQLGSIAGSNFEAVDASLLQVDPNSAEAKQGVNGNPARLANISTRMRVQTGDDVMIAGFVVSGATPKQLVINVAGPSLANFGVPNVLQNPTLTLVRQSDGVVIGFNDDWQAAANSAQIQASGFAPSNAAEPAILTTLAPGAYTAIVQGAGNTSGVGLVGVFEVDRPDIPFVNISTRGRVLSGDDVMIAGFIIQGNAAQTVVVNVAGPSLANFGVASPLANPTLTLVRSSDNAVIATNDDWGSALNAADIQASGFAPSHPSEPAILMTLPPGAYTAIVQGVGGGTGVGLVGVFRTP